MSAVTSSASAAWVHVTRTQSVATVTLNRPELHNAFNAQVIAELKAAFEDLAQDASVRAVVLQSVGKSFSAGADLNWMQQMVAYTFEENVADAGALFQMLAAIRYCPKPVIARVHGAAFGGGVGLIAACDLAVGVSSATFALTEVKLGILPAVISPFVLEKIGGTAARRYFLTAEKFNAQDAYQMGLLAAVVETEADLDAQVLQWCEAIAANGPEAVTIAKHMVSDVLAVSSLAEAETLTCRLIAERRISTEGQEGLKAFLEKREPAWRLEASSAHV